MVHIYNGILLSHKEEWNCAICGNMYVPRDCQTKWNKSESKRNISYVNVFKWNLENGTDESVCTAEIDRINMDTKGEGRWDELGDRDWHVHITMYKIGN